MSKVLQACARRQLDSDSHSSWTRIRIEAALALTTADEAPHLVECTVGVCEAFNA